MPKSTFAIRKIVVRIEVGSNRMSASDDPLFLHLEGACGREFRLSLGDHESLRKGAADDFVLAPSDSGEANVENPELNDPTTPPLYLEGIERVALRKGLDPIPNVRGVGELDDRLEITHARVEFHVDEQEKPIRYERTGPFWLGLACGLSLDLGAVKSP